MGWLDGLFEHGGGIFFVWWWRVFVEQTGGWPACCCGLVEFWICGYFGRWLGAPRELIEILIFHETGDFYDCYFCVVDGAAAIGAGFFPYFIDLALCDDSGAFFYEAVCGA